MDGKIIVIDIPVDKYREIGQHAGVIWAQLFQRSVDRRRYVAPFVRPVFLWEDEAHYFTIEHDARFQTTARKKGIAVVTNNPELAELPGCLRARRSAQSQYTARQPRNEDPAPKRGSDYERVGVEGDRQRDAVQAFNVELGLASIQ
jgi:hypothetical protein